MQPSIFLSDLNNHCLTFYWPDHPTWYLGYRLIEAEPLTAPLPAVGHENQPVRALPYAPVLTNNAARQVTPPYPEWLTSFQESDPLNPYQFSFQGCGAGSTTCSAHLNHGVVSLDWLFEPVADGIWITLQVEALTALSGVYGLQQCLRFTGAFNEYWRRRVAKSPFLSEFDLQAMGQPGQTLTFSFQQDAWLAFPVPYTVFPTTPGLSLVNSNAASAIDHGLVLRQTLDRQVTPHWYWERVARGSAWNTITAGMYWERTLLVSNRHPADCLHAVIDLAPLSAGQTRLIHGKFYCIEGTKDDLLETWRKDFQY